MRIFNIGSMNLDNTYQVDAFLKPGETKASLGYQLFCGGKGLNQSIACARAGAKVFHAGFFGDGSEPLQDILKKSCVDLSLMRGTSGKCGHTIIEVDAKGQNCILLYGGSNRSLTKEYVDSVLDACAKDDVLLLQNETNLVGYAIGEAGKRGIRVAFNAAPMEKEVMDYPLSSVTWLFVNEVEGAALSGETEFPRIAEKLSKMYPKTAIILTLGKEGVLYRKGNEEIKLGTYLDAPVVDTTAAGDTFTGYFLSQTAECKSAKEALLFATAASSLCVGRKGAAPSIPTKDEVKGAITSGMLGEIR